MGSHIISLPDGAYMTWHGDGEPSEDTLRALEAVASAAFDALDIPGPDSRCETHTFVTRKECGCDDEDRRQGFGRYYRKPHSCSNCSGIHPQSCIFNKSQPDCICPKGAYLRDWNCPLHGGNKKTRSA